MLLRCSRCHRKTRLLASAILQSETTCSECQTSLRRPFYLRAGFAWFFLVATFFFDALLLIGIFIVSLYDILGPERWWVTGFLLYMPRDLWLLLLLLLLPANLIVAQVRTGRRFRRSLLIAGIVTALWIAGPLMGFRIPTRWTKTAARTPGVRLRVLTYNVKDGTYNTQEIADEIQRANPDLVQIQASGKILSTKVGKVLSVENGWTVRVWNPYIVASRWNLSEVSFVGTRVPGRDECAIRTVLTPPTGRPITLYNTHLMSARYGLMSVRARNPAVLSENLMGRLDQANKLTAMLLKEPPGPLLLTGDLNAPPSSLIKRRLKETGLRDAFESVGLGYGYSYGKTTKAAHSYIRIDCVMTNAEIQPESIYVGNDKGSDHRPVIADLFIPDRS